jgi:hypothetical protein
MSTTRAIFFSYCPVRYRQTVRSETLRIWAISGAVKPCFFSSSALRGLAFVLPFARPLYTPLTLAAVIPAAWRSRVC